MIEQMGAPQYPARLAGVIFSIMPKRKAVKSPKSGHPFGVVVDAKHLRSNGAP
jgi:hypothetical protein